MLNYTPGARLLIHAHLRSPPPLAGRLDSSTPRQAIMFVGRNAARVLWPSGAPVQQGLSDAEADRRAQAERLTLMWRAGFRHSAAARAAQAWQEYFPSLPPWLGFVAGFSVAYATLPATYSCLFSVASVWLVLRAREKVAALHAVQRVQRSVRSRWRPLALAAAAAYGAQLLFPPIALCQNEKTPLTLARAQGYLLLRAGVRDAARLDRALRRSSRRSW